MISAIKDSEHVEYDFRIYIAVSYELPHFISRDILRICYICLINFKA